MAARRTPDETQTAEQPQPNPAVVRTQEYAAGEGWQVGQTAPADAYRALSDQGSGQVTGPVLDHHPGGYARQIVTKGALITQGVRRELDAAEQSESAEG